MYNIKPVKVMILTPGYMYKKGVLIGKSSNDLYIIKLAEQGRLECYKGDPIFITELTLDVNEFIVIEGLGEVLYE